MDRNVSSSFPIIKLNDHILLLHSSPPARVPKLQLAVEQSLTGGRWNAIKKKIPHVQRQRSSHRKMVGEASSRQNQTQYPPVG